MSRRNDRDPIGAARRTAAGDRDAAMYARKRWRRRQERAKQERAQFDPSPPSDADWTVAEEDTDGVRKLSRPLPIGEALDQVVRRRGWDERLRGAAAWTRWEEIVGTDMARRCEPVRLAGGVLVVRAESSVWATQLRYLVPQLRANATEVLGTGAVRSVHIVVGPLERGEPGAAGC